MGRGLSVVGASLLALGTVGVFVACKSEEEPSTFEPTFGEKDAAAEPPGFKPDGGGTPGVDGGPPAPTSCAPKVPDPFQPTAWKAPVKAEACDADELAGYYAACLVDPADTEKKCETWRAAHDACTKCIEPTDKSGPIQWHLDRKLATLNSAGCISLTTADVADDGCAAAYDKAVQCTRQSCDWCIEAGGSYSAYTTCQQGARTTGVCQSLETARQSKCQGVTTKADGGASACTLAQGETQEQLFVRVEGIFCGK
jgi:hypothetical protein